MGFLKAASDLPPFSVALVGVGSAALVITIYHCIVICCCNRHRPPPTAPQPSAITSEVPSRATGISMPQLIIPGYKYQKGIGLIGEDGTCAVCLCEFEEGEELRILPECQHSYHAPCIDMWLYSHPNCPVCRTNATS